MTDRPSPAMLAWLGRADPTGRLPNVDREGHRIDPKIMRACRWRGWALFGVATLETDTLERVFHIDDVPENDDRAVWFITDTGREIRRKFEWRAT